MFASAIPGDVAKRTLAPDDIQGVCDDLPGRRRSDDLPREGRATSHARLRRRVAERGGGAALAARGAPCSRARRRSSATPARSSRRREAPLARREHARPILRERGRRWRSSSRLLASSRGSPRARRGLRALEDRRGQLPFFWKESCVPVTIYLNGFDHASGMSAAQIVKSVAAAAHSLEHGRRHVHERRHDDEPVPRDRADARGGERRRRRPRRGTRATRSSSAPRCGRSRASRGTTTPFEALAVTTVTARSTGTSSTSTWR